MTLYPGGRECYCGKRGCLDAYCSAQRLSSLTEGKLDRFLRSCGKGTRSAPRLGRDIRRIW